jgi:hypothetical protein
MANQISNIGGQWDIVLSRGSDFVQPSIAFQNADGTPVDLTGCRFVAEMRKTGLSVSVALTFAVEPVDLEHGVIKMSAAAADTALLACGESMFDPASMYVWGMYMLDANDLKSTTLFGNVNVMRQVPRA